jgi:hypothetical protein
VERRRAIWGFGFVAFGWFELYNKKGYSQGLPKYKTNLHFGKLKSFMLNLGEFFEVETGDN